MANSLSPYRRFRKFIKSTGFQGAYRWRATSGTSWIYRQSIPGLIVHGMRHTLAQVTFENGFYRTQLWLTIDGWYRGPYPSDPPDYENTYRTKAEAKRLPESLIDKHGEEEREFNETLLAMAGVKL
jgi:hypothetical protein